MKIAFKILLLLVTLFFIDTSHTKKQTHAYWEKRWQDLRHYTESDTSIAWCYRIG